MSGTTKQAHTEFANALRVAEHTQWFSATSQTGPGRRHRQPALHRAVVVLTAAAWQAFVQDTTRAILTGLAVPPTDPGHPLYNLVKAATSTAIGRFNTPDSRNSISLFTNVGFDPAPLWSFTIGEPPRVYQSQDVLDELDGWLGVRHTIAHGSQLPTSPLVSGRTQHGPSLHRSDSERCLRFFEALVRVTADAADAQFP